MCPGGLEDLISEGSGLTFSPSGELLASASLDHTAGLGRVETGESLHVLRGHNGRVYGVAFSPDGASVATSSQDGRLALWSVESGQPLQVFTDHRNFVVGPDLMARPPLQRLVNLPGPADCVAIASEGDRIAVGFSSGALRVYALPGMELLAEREDAHSQDIKRLRFDNDGGRLASASRDHTTRLWEITATGVLQAQRTFEGHTSSVHDVAFSPDGETLATAGFDGQVGLFSIGSDGTRFFETHDGRVASVAFSADGDRLLVGDGDNRKARLWDIRSDPPVPIIGLPRAQRID